MDFLLEYKSIAKNRRQMYELKRCCLNTDLKNLNSRIESFFESLITSNEACYRMRIRLLMEDKIKNITYLTLLNSTLT